MCPDGRIFLETYSPVYKQVCGFQGVVECRGKGPTTRSCMSLRGAHSPAAAAVPGAVALQYMIYIWKEEK